MKWKVQLDNIQNNKLVVKKNSYQELIITESFQEEELFIFVEENAQLIIKQEYKQDTPIIIKLIISVEKNAQVMHELFIATASSIACSYEFILVGAGALVKSSGFIHGINQSSSVIRVEQLHKEINTESLVSFKTVLDDTALYDYQGTIIINKNAVNAKAAQHDKVLLLHAGATATSIPSLQVNCNAVQCSHASVISCINDDQLTMLSCRGITKTEAKKLIVAGFLKH
ncbi:SufD family Fe-S cluster assembly protein [bacterium]|nr:SufD family Fe-S cluster assembly protein [bacterium]